LHMPGARGDTRGDLTGGGGGGGRDVARLLYAFRERYPHPTPGSMHSLVEWAPTVELMASISARDFYKSLVDPTP